MEKVNLGNFIYDGLENNEYLNEIYSLLLDSYLEKTINGFPKNIDINLHDALSFADLLSNQPPQLKENFINN